MSEALYSPGLEGIIAGETAVSTIDAGLHYRGYSIEESGRRMPRSMKSAYLLLYGELPKADELAEFRASAARTPRCRIKSSTCCG